MRSFFAISLSGGAQKSFSSYTLQRTANPRCKSFVGRAPRITTPRRSTIVSARDSRKQPLVLKHTHMRKGPAAFSAARAFPSCYEDESSSLAVDLVRNAGRKPKVMLRIGRPVRQAGAHVIDFKRAQREIFREPDVESAADLHRKCRSCCLQPGRRRVCAIKRVHAAEKRFAEKAGAMPRS